MKYSFFISILLSIILISCEDSSTGDTTKSEVPTFLKPGNYKFTFDEYSPLKDKPIPVHTFLPIAEADNKSLPIIFVMHGHSRNVIENCQDWFVHANKYNFIILCPEFNANMFPNSENYQNGMMYLNNQFTDSTKWTYNLIEEIFTYLKEKDVTTRDTYGVYGFSGGGQFVHRYALFTNPRRASFIMPAGSGWYTLPNFSENFPYGLKNAPFDESSLAEKFQLPITIIVGENDNNPNDSSLRKTAEAMRQGNHRFERAKFFYNRAVEGSDKLGVNLNWTFRSVPNIGHSAVDIAPIAAELFHNSLNN
tara:strand:+ start:285 stop:1205 length:921 start_codon:yes stop_codon:yes gene_type:complete